MTGVPSAFARALGQLGDRRLLAVLAKSIAVTLAIFAALGIALWRGMARLIDHYAVGYGELGGLIFGQAHLDDHRELLARRAATPFGAYGAYLRHVRSIRKG